MADQVTSSLAEAKILVMQGMKGEDGTDGKSLRVNSAGHVAYWDDDTQQWVDTGIEVEGVPGPRGEKGDKGDKGDRGDTGSTGSTGPQGPQGVAGVSPTVSVSSISGGHTVTITDAYGGHSFDVMDGDGGVVLLQTSTDPVGVKYYGGSSTIMVSDIRAMITAGKMPFLYCVSVPVSERRWLQYSGNFQNQDKVVFENDYYKVTLADLEGYTYIVTVTVETKPTLPVAGQAGKVLTVSSNGEWVAADVPTELPSGGSVGNVLKKTASGVEWAAESGGGGSNLPAVTTDDNGKVLAVVGGAWAKGNKYIPMPPTMANGQVLMAEDGVWGSRDIPTELPSGGTTGQVLKKTASGVEWANESGGGSAPYRIRIYRITESVPDLYDIDTSTYPVQTIIDNAYNCEAIFGNDLYKLARADKVSGTEAVLYFVAESDGGAEGFIVHAIVGTGVTVSYVDNTSLPPVTTSDNGKFLCVVNGAWSAVTMTAWSGGAY